MLLITRMFSWSVFQWSALLAMTMSDRSGSPRLNENYYFCLKITLTPYYYSQVRHHCPNAPVLLVGTKMDLREDPEMLKKLKEKQESPVSTQQVRVSFIALT